MQLVITEKPSVARDLAKILKATKKSRSCIEGPDLKITWCFGHMCELETPEHYRSEWKQWKMQTLPMIPSEFQIKLRKDVQDHWKAMEKMLQDANVTSVINACDAGREGELIFRYVYQHSKCTKPIKRLWVSSLTDEAISKAWSDLKPGKDYDNLADAARCRSEADWLVGLNATRAMTCLAKKGGGDQFLSVGRVQTPTLALIVNRDKEIENFTPEPFWRVQGIFSYTQEDENFSWKGHYFQKNIQEEKNTKEASRAERLNTKADAEAIADAVTNQIGVVSKSTKKRSTEKTPLLYDLNALQRRANQKFGYTAQQTLNIAQSLYEKFKLLTYPRTDSQYLTPDQESSIPKIIQGLGKVGPYSEFTTELLSKPLRRGKRIYNAKEVGDHHAILPTGKNPLHCKLSVEEKRVFDLVARRMMAVFFPDALYDLTTLIVDVVAKEGHQLPKHITEPLQFRSKGKVCVQKGWQKVDPPNQQKDTLLPPIQKDDKPLVSEAQVLEGKTRPPARYTEASLLSSMEKAGRNLDDADMKRAMRNAGLGTPATRANIIETLLRRNFIERNGKNLQAIERGKNLIIAVPVEELKSAILTGKWEARLANISEGKDTRKGFMKDVCDNLQEIIENIKNATPPKPERILNTNEESLGECPKCGAPVRQARSVFTCDTGRSCEFVIFGKIAKRSISKRMIKQLLSEGQTKTVKGFKSQRTGKEFQAALRLDESGKVIFHFDNYATSDGKSSTPKNQTPVGLKCPKCNKGTLIKGRNAWGCNQYSQGCNFVFAFEQDGKMITPQQAATLVLQMYK